ncbi:MAG TPA: DUF6049 family protein [Demequinaceae bacterium]
MTAGRRLGQIAGALAAAVLLAGASAGPIRAAESPATGDLSADVTSYGSPILGPDSSLTVGVTIANDAGSDADNVEVIVGVTTDPLADRASLASWQSGESAPPTREVARRLALGTGVVAAQTTVTTTVVAPPSALGLGANPWAVYGVTVAVHASGKDVKEFRTTATYLDTTPSVMPLAIIATAAGAPERVSAVLSAAAAARVSLLVDPTALALAAGAVVSTPTDVYSLPAGHVDVASLARALDSGILPTALDASAKADAPGADRPWIAVLPSLDRESLVLAQHLGAAAILLQPGTTPPTATNDEGLEGVAPALVDAGEGSPLIVVADPGLSLALAGAHVTAALRPATAVAESALLAMANRDRQIVVASPGTSWMLDAEHRSPALEALAACPWNRMVSLTSVLDGGTPVPTVLPEAPSTDGDITVSQVSVAANDLRDLGYLAAATSTPAAVYSAPAAVLLSALSFEGRGDPAARADTIARALAIAQDVLDRVSLPRGSDLNLISTSGSVPITVTNELAVDVTVTVVLETRSPNLRPTGQATVTLKPNTSETVLIPVRAVSSANVAAFVHLTDTEGHRLSSDTIVRVRVRADWGTAFTRILGAVALLLLIGGIWRTARHGRRDTRGTPGDEPLPFGSDG